MLRLYRHILPSVRNELSRWQSMAEQIPDPELKKQALNSIATKAFHCQGGAVYAAIDMDNRHILVPLIVAFQTISDYLDNLCDRSTSLDPADFRLLHQAMLDAVHPETEPADYYALRKERDDGGYLRALVETCQNQVRKLPSYPSMQPQIVQLVSLYCDLQVYKHIRHDLREKELLRWWKSYRPQYPELKWNEFAAATGSTLGVFMLFAAAADPSAQTKDGEVIRAGYFPYVCGLHILLDYLIDQDEDRLGGDLNFCNYYNGPDETVERIGWFVDNAQKNVSRLNHAHFHKMVIEGLLALYLSDPKVRQQRSVQDISVRLMRKSPLMRMFFWINSRWIRKNQGQPY
jgi:tetraprenyl-beta-curcumene synthase